MLLLLFQRLGILVRPAERVQGAVYKYGRRVERCVFLVGPAFLWGPAVAVGVQSGQPLGRLS